MRWLSVWLVLLALGSMARGQDPLARAEARIERWRKATLALQVVDAGGRPLPGVKVSVRMQRHRFLFGCNAFELLGHHDPTQERLYQDAFRKLFDFATLPFYWGAYEAVPGVTAEERLLAQARWLARHGISVKGHPLVWHEVVPAWAPPDAEGTRLRLRQRILDLLPRFSGLIDRWDVVNEATSSASFQNGVGAWVRRDGPVTVTAQSLGWARQAHPRAQLLYNDFNLGSAYEALAQRLILAHAPLDALGLQSHMHRGEWDMRSLWALCQRLERLGRPLHFTEVTVLSGAHGWQLPAPWSTTPAGEARQADYVEKLYTLLFSHPAVHAITWWDLADGGWQGAPGGLLRADRSVKPAFLKLERLLRDRWWTRAELSTGPDGRAKVRAFLGSYRIRVAGPGGLLEVDHELAPGASAPLVIQLQPDR